MINGRQVVDITLFNNEMDALNLRVKILEDLVDVFIVKESTRTFQGQPKPCLAGTYVHPKVHADVAGVPPTLTHVKGEPISASMLRERYQRSRLVDLSAYDIKDDAIILMCDVDEIPDPKQLANFTPEDGIVYAFEQKMFQYYVNVEDYVLEKWYGPGASTYKTFKTLDAQKQREMHYQIRTKPMLAPGTVLIPSGWHYSYLGGPEAIKYKFSSWSHREFTSKKVLDHVEENYNNLRDSLGRYPDQVLKILPIDDTFPEYIQTHQEELAHLIRQP